MSDISDGDIRPAVPGQSAASPRGGHNDLFDYDVGLDEILGEISERDPAPNGTPYNQSASAPAAGLGLDEEVVVTRRRQPVAKLDESLILSQKGIPRLRSTAKKLKFKGKGHEFSDAARLLNFYQLWLDDLFPRAKFADGLSMIEKLGHSKRIQVMRRQWIDEGRPGYHLENDGFDQQKTYSVTIVEGTSAALNQTPDPHGPSAATGEQHSPRIEDSMQSMEIDAPTSLERDTTERRREGDDGKLFMSDDEGGGNDVGKDAGDEDVPEEDELDALLAEHEMKEDEQLHHESTTSIVVKERAPEESFEDDLEAMADSNTPW